ncbi:MAG TPA: MFS transporter [Patescibacteria group bacterium]|nr:MFS transporter [Patescibacteria group bacterium]
MVKKKLARNFRLVFLVQALQNVKILTIVVTLFYLYRGLTLAEVFYLSIIWSVASTLFEVPSSYLADRWGRKKTIILATVLYFLSTIIQLWAWDFNLFALSLFLYGLAYACLTGTDEALVYDTERELSLGQDGKSLKRLGNYFSAQRFFKIFAPVIGAIIAKDLLEQQYISLIVIDSLFAFLAICVAFFIVEPNHHMDLEKKEAGILLDGVNLLKKNPLARQAMFNRSLIFIGSLILWRYHQDFFTNLGIPIVVLGLVAGVSQGVMFLGNRRISKLTKHLPLYKSIDLFNFLSVASLVALLIIYLVYPSKYLILLFYSLFGILEVLRWPLFSEYFNSISNSYNRATTLSLASFVKGFLDIPLLFISGLLVVLNPIYPYILVLILVIFTSIIFRLRDAGPLKPKSSYGSENNL